MKADDLIDRVIEKALAEVDRRQSDLPAAERRKIAEQIGVAAVRYFLIKYSRTTVIAFDIDEALSFDGETRPVSAVRRRSRQQHLPEAAGAVRPRRSRDAGSDCPSTPPDADRRRTHELWALVLEASRLDDVVEQVVRSLEFAVLAKYRLRAGADVQRVLPESGASILNEERADVRRWRAAAVVYFRQQLTRVLDLMGVAVPARM